MPPHVYEISYHRISPPVIIRLDNFIIENFIFKMYASECICFPWKIYDARIEREIILWGAIRIILIDQMIINVWYYRH